MERGVVAAHQQLGPMGQQHNPVMVALVQRRRFLVCL
jgi:hypothetical protein